MVEAVDGSPVLCAYLHEGGMASRVGSRARRFLCTGHANGTMQVWDLTTALQRGQHAPRASSAAASGAAVVISKGAGDFQRSPAASFFGVQCVLSCSFNFLLFRARRAVCRSC